MRTILLFYLFIFLSGCSPVIRVIYDIREPKIESKEGLLKYLEKKNIATDNVVFFTDTTSRKSRYEMLRNKLIQIQVFDIQQVQIYYKDTLLDCNGPAYDYTNSICDDSVQKVNHNLKLHDITKNLIFSNGELLEKHLKRNMDYYVFIYWARSAGRLNKTAVRQWEENLNAQKNCKIQVVKVNLDKLDYMYKIQ